MVAAATTTAATTNAYAKRELPGRSQRPMRGDHQAHGQAAEQHAAENQSLGKIEHVRSPCRMKG